MFRSMTDEDPVSGQPARVRNGHDEAPRDGSARGFVDERRRVYSTTYVLPSPEPPRLHPDPSVPRQARHTGITKRVEGHGFDRFVWLCARPAQTREQVFTESYRLTLKVAPHITQLRSSLSTPEARRHAALHLFEQNRAPPSLFDSNAVPQYSQMNERASRRAIIRRPFSRCHSMPSGVLCHSAAIGRMRSACSRCCRRRSSDIGCRAACSVVVTHSRFLMSLFRGSPSL